MHYFDQFSFAIYSIQLFSIKNLAHKHFRGYQRVEALPSRYKQILTWMLIPIIRVWLTEVKKKKMCDPNARIISDKTRFVRYRRMLSLDRSFAFPTYAANNPKALLN